MPTVGSLFSGIGGMDLGLERAGWEVKWQIENNDYCTRVLEKHWPDVRRYGDIQAVDPAGLERVDLICGGFPCQPWSVVGRGDGESDDRNMWPDTIRVIRGVGPKLVLLENVPALLTHRYFGTILGDLAESGYDAEWNCIPAAAVGAPHLRYRLFIVAYSGKEQNGHGERRAFEVLRNGSEGSGNYLRADEGQVADTPSRVNESGRTRGHVGGLQAAVRRGSGDSNNWDVEPDVDRVANGVPARVDRLRGLGNAVVPQVAEWIGRRLLPNVAEVERVKCTTSK